MNQKYGRNEGKEPGRLFTVIMNNVIVASCTLATWAVVVANAYLPSLQKRFFLLSYIESSLPSFT